MDQYIDNDLYERSNNDIIVDLGARFKNYRMALRLTQKEVQTKRRIRNDDCPVRTRRVHGNAAG